MNPNSDASPPTRSEIFEALKGAVWFRDAGLGGEPAAAHHRLLSSKEMGADYCGCHETFHF